MSGWLPRLASRLRFLADRIDPAHAPRSTHWPFTFEHERGLVWREDGRGCPVWYLGEDDYERAHREADTDHMIVNWENAAARHGKERP